MSSEEHNGIDTSSIITFINILCAHLADRFPEDEVQKWSTFDCEAIVKCDFNFGIHQVRSLCSKYKDFLAEEIVIVSQYNDLKFAVAERIKSQLVLSFLVMVTFTHQNEQFQDLAKLMDSGGTVLASSANCVSDYTMASNGKETTMASPEHGEEEQQNVLRRVASLPLVNSAYDLAATAYASTKESHPYVRSICDMAEKGVTSITNAAVGSAQPAVTKLEPEAAATADEEGVSEVPDKVEENLPILQQTADEATCETQELASSRLTDVKETMIRMADMTKEAVQDSMKATKSVVTDSMSTVVESRMGQLAISGMEAVLEKSEELLDHYLPMTDDELAELAESVEGAGVSSAQPEEHRSYFVRLGSLSTRLRQRAYRYSLNKMRHTSQSIREALSQLHQTMGLIEYLKQGVSFQEVQEKFAHIWLSWNKEQPKSSEIKDLAKPEMESETLAMSRSIIQQLQDACQMLVSSIQGLPANFQDKVKQVYHNMEELHASFSTAHSFQDLSSSLLTQSQEMVTKAQEYVDELMAYVMENTPLSWVVGPFIPSGKASADSLEPRNQEKEAEEASKSKEDL
ncbi:perilipin-3-like [Pangshura tecta]